MKKLAAFAALATVLAVSVTAFADASVAASVAYTGGAENTATVTGVEGYSTVLITDSNGNIVYVNQEDSAFSGIKNFLMKNSGSQLVGQYTARFGSGSGNYETKTFYVGVNSGGVNDVPMTRLSSNLESDGKYSTGFFRTVSANEYGNYNSLKVGCKNGDSTVWGSIALKEKGFPETITTGEGDLALVFELNEIEENQIASVSVFLSQEVVGSESANQ